MQPDPDFRNQTPEFWALVKLASQELGYSHRATKSSPSRARSYASTEVVAALRGRGLDPTDQSELVQQVARVLGGSSHDAA